MSFFVKFLIFITGLVVLVLSPALFVFVIFATAPSIVAYIVDRLPGKNTSTTVAMFNLSGVSVYASDIFSNSSSLSSFMDVLDPFKLMVVYLFAALGWFLIWIIPRFTTVVMEYSNDAQVVELEHKLEKMIEEWGEEVKN
ncbi:MAG: hypothetical protein COV36_03040 [Alphaproteobacteria bacterium CG11_big_fil_rev_8_21_14_0_20_44_7]|nr:MAG: hypothetical protein COV36_03040 [Alphaproteobacteria bacterium CG11_big_fil_rev_8_21_14_0_20_44_7]